MFLQSADNCRYLSDLLQRNLHFGDESAGPQDLLALGPRLQSGAWNDGEGLYGSTSNTAPQPLLHPVPTPPAWVVLYRPPALPRVTLAAGAHPLVPLPNPYRGLKAHARRFPAGGLSSNTTP